MDTKLIHIGYPKTATTWFQNNFYPFVRNFHFTDRELVKKEMIFRNSLEVKAEPLLLKEGNLIVCEEMLIGSVQNGSLHGLAMERNAMRIKESFPGAEIIIFLRNQPELIQSSYLQYLRTGGTLSFRKFLFPSRKLNQINRFCLFDFSFFEFIKIIDFYKLVFGEKNVHVFLFEEFRDNPLVFLKNFSEKFHLEVDLNQIDLNLRKPGFSLWLVPFIRFLNSFTNQSILNKYYILNIPGIYGLVRKLILASSRHTKRKQNTFIGSRAIREYIEEYYRESNNKLTHFFPEDRLKEFNYPL